MIDNIPKLIEHIKDFQQGDYLHTKNQEKANKIYYKYSKVIELLKEIENIKMENYFKENE